MERTSGGRAPGTGAALRPVLAGMRAMSGALSAKRCVKLAPCSVAQDRQVGGWTMAQARPLGRRLDEHRGETPRISSVSALLQPLVGLVSAGQTQCRHYPVFKKWIGEV